MHARKMRVSRYQRYPRSRHCRSINSSHVFESVWFDFCPSMLFWLCARRPGTRKKMTYQANIPKALKGKKGACNPVRFVKNFLTGLVLHDIQHLGSFLICMFTPRCPVLFIQPQWASTMNAKPLTNLAARPASRLAGIAGIVKIRGF